MGKRRVIHHATDGDESAGLADPNPIPNRLNCELRDGIRHPSDAATRETLLAWRFFCLAAALLSPEPPLLLMLNEPEAGRHSG